MDRVTGCVLILDCMQIFANNDDQRQWIIEEILGSLIRLPDFKQKGSQFRCAIHLRGMPI
jgi:hypothetical protein